MSKDESYFAVARTTDEIYVRVHGLGNLLNAPFLNSFFEKSIEAGRADIVVDLGPCRGVDSTFMGTLLGISTKCKEDGGTLVLLNVGSHCRKQLGGIGLDSFLTFRESGKCPREVELRKLKAREVSSNERLKLILKAHKDLVAIDERNEAKFGPFLRSILKEG